MGTAERHDWALSSFELVENYAKEMFVAKICGSLNIEPANLEALAKRVQQNGFYESGGGIWQAQANPNTPQGRIAAEARSLVREIIADILANG